MNLPMAPTTATAPPLELYDVAELQAEVRALAAEMADPRRIDLVCSPNVEAAFHLPVRPGTTSRS